MNTASILAALDEEIARLQRVHFLLSQSDTNRKLRGRPTGSTNAKSTKAAGSTAKKRTLSPEGKKRIAEAQKKRWAKLKSAAATKAKSKLTEIKITKVPAKAVRAKRAAKPKPKATTALSGKVQEGPIAAPPKA
jgi:hypothetical protein